MHIFCIQALVCVFLPSIHANKNLGLSGQAKSTQRLPRTPCCRTSTTPPLTRAPSTPTPSLKYTHAKSHVQLRHHWNRTLNSQKRRLNRSLKRPVRLHHAWRMPNRFKYLRGIQSHSSLIHPLTYEPASAVYYFWLHESSCWIKVVIKGSYRDNQWSKAVNG